MPFWFELICQSVLIGYVVTSPFLFFWFHKCILRQSWDDDWTDRVTVTLYFFSNLIAAYISYMIQECQRCI